MTDDSTAPLPPNVLTGLHHVRLTVTDIDRSKAFYTRLFGCEPAIDFTGEDLATGVRSDPLRFFGGCTYAFNNQLLGLRPVASPTDRFDSTRVGLDHLSFGVNAIDDLHRAAQRFAELGVDVGVVTERPGLGIAIVSFQDPDDINLELVAPLS